MIYCNLILTLLLLMSFFSDKNAFRTERIVGGYSAYEHNYKYQAAILGNYNLSDISNLLGSAAIISDYLLLTAARCFVVSRNKLKKQTFFAVVGQVLLKADGMILRDIEKIYTYFYCAVTKRNDLAVVRLKESLDLSDSMELTSLALPTPAQTFYNRTGTVTGFGVDSPDDKLITENRERVRIYGSVEQELKYAFVKISTRQECAASYSNINQHLLLCGRIQPDYRFSERGVCVGDIGAPLIVGTTLVGIVSKHRRDCNDTVYGTIYTKISAFFNFIDSIRRENPIPGATVYYNLPHLFEADI